ncbi:MAG: hypothetical protein GYB35_16100 [Algicola sp.]|nr:hypothetical protein [Algicola sp.]
MTINGRKLFIEIAVTHYVDEEKLRKIENSGISTIEIDLSEYRNGFTKEQLEETLIQGTKAKQWIYNTKTEILTKQFFDRIDRELQAEKNFDNYLKELKQYKIDLAKYNGHKVIEFSELGKICCTKLVSANLQNIKVHHPVLSKLRNKEVWDGDIHSTNGGASFVFINSKKSFFSPSFYKRNNASNQKRFEYRRMYAILSKLASQSLVEEQICKECEFYEDIFDNDSKIVCKYHKLITN